MKTLPMLLQWLSILLAFAVLIWMAENGHATWDTLTATIYTALGMLMRHMAQVWAVPTNEPAPAPGDMKQAGFARLAALAVLFATVAGAVLLAGCAPMATSWYAGAEAAIVRDARTTNDNVIVTLKDAWCGLPYSAIQRNGPEVATSIQQLCGPLPSGLTASELQLLLRAAQMGVVTLPAEPISAPSR